jgi:hypothetical protein
MKNLWRQVHGDQVLVLLMFQPRMSVFHSGSPLTRRPPWCSTGKKNNIKKYIFFLNQKNIFFKSKYFFFKSIKYFFLIKKNIFKNQKKINNIFNFFLNNKKIKQNKTKYF